jgi:hypothetical protein
MPILQSDIDRFDGIGNSRYQGFNHLLYLMGDYAAIARLAEGVAEEAAAFDTQYAAFLAALGGELGNGLDPLSVPMVALLGAAARADEDSLRGRLFPFDLGGATQLDAILHRGLLILSNGFPVTLPPGTDPYCTRGWDCIVRNRHASSSITVTPDAASGIDGGTVGTAVTITAGNWRRFSMNANSGTLAWVTIS